MNFDVMFYEVFKEEEALLKSFLPNSISAGFTNKTIQEHVSTDPPAPIICVRTQSQIPLEWAHNLESILSRSTGYDHLLEYKRKTNAAFPLGYLPHYCSRSVAEHAWMLVMNLLKKYEQQRKQFDTFCRDHLTGREIFNQKVVVIGVGHIGSQIVQIGLRLGADVKGVDIEPKMKGIEYLSLEDAVSWANVVISALPLTGDTFRLLDYDILKKMSPGGFFINVGRGEVSATHDLKRLLDEGVLSGLALDVFENENKIATELRGQDGSENTVSGQLLKLKEFPNVILTPHNAFNTEQALERKAGQTIDAIVQFRKTGEFPSFVETHRHRHSSTV